MIRYGKTLIFTVALTASAATYHVAEACTRIQTAVNALR